jgi:hypothetical protein
MTIFRRFRIWVDEVQSGSLYAGKLLYAAGAIPLLATPILGGWWRIPAIAMAVAWVAFLLWRLWLMAKTGLIASDVPQGRLVDKAKKRSTRGSRMNGS